MILIFAPIAAILAAAISSFVTIYLYRHQHSGNVEDSSNAQDLWQASKNIIDEQRAEILDLRVQVKQLGAEIAECKTEAINAKNQALTLQGTVNELRTELALYKTEAGLIRKNMRKDSVLLQSIQQEVRAVKSERLPS